MSSPVVIDYELRQDFVVIMHFTKYARNGGKFGNGRHNNLSLAGTSLRPNG